MGVWPWTVRHQMTMKVVHLGLERTASKLQIFELVCSQAVHGVLQRLGRDPEVTDLPRAPGVLP